MILATIITFRGNRSQQAQKNYICTTSAQRLRSYSNVQMLCYCYVWTFSFKYIRFCLDLDTFIIICRGLFLPEFLSQWFLAQWSLCFGEVCYDFSKNSQLFFRIYSGFSGSLSANQSLANDVHVGGLKCAISPWVFIQLASNLVTMILMFCRGVLWLSHSSCYCGFIQDFLAVQRQKAVSSHIQVSRYYLLAL